MIASRAMKIYKTVNNAENYVTTVFTPYDADKLINKLLKEAGVMLIRVRSAKGTTLLTQSTSSKSKRRWLNEK